MPGPSYLGDRVGSNAGSRSLPGLKRRANALEDSIWVKGSTRDVNSVPLTIDGSDNVHFAAGAGSGFAISKWDADGNPLGGIGIIGTASDEIDSVGTIGAITYGAGGFIWFVKGSTIYKISPGGTYQDEFTAPSSRQGLAASHSGTNLLYMQHSTPGNNTVYQYNTSFSEQRNFTANTNSPAGMYTDTSDFFYDEGGSAVGKYDDTGSLDTVFDVYDGSGGDAQGLIVSSTDEIAVGDLNGNIQTIKTDNTERASWAPGGDVNYLAVDSGNLIYHADGSTMEKWDFDGNLDSSWTVNNISQSLGQTTWYKYPTDDLADKVSLGTPDGGVSIPAANALQGLRPRPNDIYEVRDVIEAIAQYFTNVVTGNAFNWTDLSADNLFHVAVTASIYDWPNFLLPGIRMRENHIEELLLCIVKLEASVMSG